MSHRWQNFGPEISPEDDSRPDSEDFNTQLPVHTPLTPKVQALQLLSA